MISKAELKTTLLECFKIGHLTEGFATIALEVARMHIHKKYWSSTYAYRQDYLSGFSLRLVNKWMSIDPEANIHAYLCRMVGFAALDVIRKNQRHSGKLKMFNQICCFYHPHQTNEQKRKYLGAVCC